MGYSQVRVDNAEAQAASAFKNGNYALLNLMYRPVSPFLSSTELQWGKRENFGDGFSSSVVRVQISFEYDFSQPVFKRVEK